MTWIKGPEYWENQKKEVEKKEWRNPKKIPTPEKMWELFCDYCADVDGNPAQKEEQKRGSSSTKIDMDSLELVPNDKVVFKVPRPYTWVGFEAYLGLKGVMCSNLSEYKSNRKGGYEAFSEITTRIDKIMYAQKFEGAAMGHFNPNIIARYLGLSENTNVIEEKKDFDYSKLSDESLAEIAALKNEK